MTKHPLRLALLATVFCLPVAAVAQTQPTAPAADSSGFDVSDAPATPAAAAQFPPNSIKEITIGIGGVSDTSDVFGRYNGKPKSGPGFIGGWLVQHRAAWDSGKTDYFTFTGENIDAGNGRVLPEASINIKIGQQGHWWLSGAYTSMTYVASDHFNTVLDRLGNLSTGYFNAITAAGAFVSNSATPNIGSGTFYGTSYKASGSTGIASSAGSHVAQYGAANQFSLVVGTRRDKGAVSGGFQQGFWLFTAAFSHEHKEGSLEQAMTTGGSNAGMMTFAMPVDYDTDIYMASAAYNTHRFQAVFSYELSNFVDNNKAGYAFQGWNFTNVKDPVSKTFTAYELSGVYALPPSNQAHTFTAQLAYNASATTRLNATLVYGLQLQNDPFTAVTQNAYTLNTGGVAGPTHNTLGAAAAPLGLNPASLQGVVHTWFGSAGFTARPQSQVDIRGTYTVDVRDPHTAAMWIYGDPTDAVQNSRNIKYRQAVPESWTKQKLNIQAGFHLLPETRLTVG